MMDVLNELSVGDNTTVHLHLVASVTTSTAGLTVPRVYRVSEASDGSCQNK